MLYSDDLYIYTANLDLSLEIRFCSASLLLDMSTCTSEHLKMTASKIEIPSGYHYAPPAGCFIQSLKLGILDSIFFCFFFFFFFFFLPFACLLLVTRLFRLCFLKTSWIQPLLIFLSYSQSSGSHQVLLRLRHNGFLKNLFLRGNNRCKYH